MFMQDILSERTKAAVREGKGREMDGLLAGVQGSTANQVQVPVDMTGHGVNLAFTTRLSPMDRSRAELEPSDEPAVQLMVITLTSFPPPQQIWIFITVHSLCTLYCLISDGFPVFVFGEPLLRCDTLMADTAIGLACFILYLQHPLPQMPRFGMRNCIDCAAAKPINYS